MKKYLLVLLALTSLTLLVGCKEKIEEISINGLQDITVSVGTEVPSFLDGVTLSNDETGVVVDSSALNMEEIGVYPVTFTYTSGGDTLSKSINVSVVGEPVDEHPIIVGAKPLTYVIGNELPDYLDGVSAIDSKFGDLSYVIDVNTDDVNYDVIGEYNVVYHVVNSDGYHYQKTCKITVTGANVVGQISSEFFVVKNELGYYGVISNTGEIVIDNEFMYIEGFGDGVLILGNKEDVISFYNTETGVFFHLDYYDFNPFNEGYAVVESENEKYAYVNSNGELVTDFVYGYAENFENGLAVVNRTGEESYRYDSNRDGADYSDNENFGVIDINFNFVVPTIYDRLNVLSDDTYLVSINNDNYIINSSNERLFSVDDFYYQSEYLDDGTLLLQFENDNKVFYLNEDITLYYDSQTENVSFIYDNYYTANVDGGVVIFNLKEKTMYQDVRSFDIRGDLLYYTSSTFNYLIDLPGNKLLLNTNYTINGYYNAELGLFDVSNDNGLHGVVSKTSTVFPCTAIGFLRYNNEPEKYQTSEYKYGYLGEDGTPITNTEYFYLSYFNEGYAYFKESSPSSNMGVIDTNGDVVIEPTYKNISDFRDGVAIAGVDMGEGVIGYKFINTSNNDISANRYSQITYYSDSVYLVKDLTTSKYGVVNKNDEIMIPLVYSSLSVSETFAIGSLETAPSEYALINFDGTVLTDFELENYIKTYDERIVLRKDGYFGVVDSEGVIVFNYVSPGIGGVYDNKYIVAKTQMNYYYYIFDNSTMITNSFFSYVDYLQDGMFGVSMIGEYRQLFDAKTKFRTASEFKNIDDFVDNKAIAENTYGNKVIIDRVGNYLSYESEAISVIDDFVINIYDNSFSIRFMDKSLILDQITFVEEDYDEDEGLYVVVARNDYAEAKLYLDITDYDLNNLVKFELIIGDNVYLIDSNKSITHVATNKTISNFDDFQMLDNNYFIFEFNGEHSLYNKNLDIMNDLTYDFYYQSPDLSLFLVTLQGNFGMIDLENNELLSPIYDRIIYLDGETFIVSIGNFKAVYNLSSGFITEFMYSEVHPIGYELYQGER
ncbi:hypothetical protein CI105_03915 [Candidatus Izimaplasma bacterium ZiA1]|uniref:WG repeat-containing protein n=1 Tax=Candidatus Izimoplasma sp. ZiA1 TaxID=2024899 RepID=UPI000BAA524D|nr:hypothetical protein CI105_03915 [Candidatus Izimaplasma bacterium ZiA1]